MDGGEQLNVIFDAVPTAIAYVDREQRFGRINAAYRARFGEVTGKSLADALGDAYEHVRSHVERALRGELVRFELELAFADGSSGWVEAHFVPDRDEHGSVRGFTAQLHDVSAHHAARARLALLADASTKLATSIDQDATLQMIAELAVPALAEWAAVYVDRFGVLLAAAVAHDGHITSEAAWQRARELVPQAQLATTVQDGKLVVPLVARSKRLGVLVLAPGQPRAWPLDDIELVEELGRRATAALEVTRLFEQQRRANDLLQEADRRKDDLLAMVGHELRNPLAPIITALDLMDYRNLVGCERERGVIRRQALHMSRLVDDLLDVARVRSGKVALNKQAIELHTVITKAIEQTSPLLEERNHQLIVDVPRDLVVSADSMRLTQVFANLLTNAAKYTQPRGHITISAAQRDGTIAVQITDDGPGIASELLAAIFEPFVQADRTLSRAQGGLGLGLALVRNFTELHGGTVTATSDGPGRGATFTIELPAHAPAPRLAKSSQPPPTGSRLLLVDDNADAAHVLADLLREHGYEVAVAYDAPAALLLADEFRPSIALLDIGLPVMDGYELARHLRSRLPSPPRLVAVTGYGDHADPDRTRDAGFEVHLGKPVDFDKLVSVLGSLARS